MRSWGLAGTLVAIAAAAVLPACARTPAEPDGLTWRPVETPGFELLPRVIGDGAEGLNALFSQLDDEARTRRADCLSAENEHADYERDVSAPFTGPRFLTVTVHESYYCGGFHPDVDIRAMTFDRRTGGLPDWDSLWPGAAVTASTNGSGNLPAVSSAPALTAWFRAAVRADAASDAEWLAQCDPWYGDDPVDEPLTLWLNAEAGGIGLDWASLPHAAKACASPRIMPVEDAARLGASPELIDALRRGHAARAFHRGPHP
jgi:hypothetical protein